MPDTQEILASIETRLECAREEISILEAGLAALTAKPTPDLIAAIHEPKPVAANVRRRVLVDGVLEGLLGRHTEGLSGAALTEQTGAAYGAVTARLKELLVAGRVRSSGTRRTSLWHLITDNDRIAERAAEREKLQAPPALTAS